jgi:ribosomal protein S18 acetylase RimI-like enzyme
MTTELQKAFPPHPKIRLHPLTAKNVAGFRMLNSTVLQSKYSDRWYKDALALAPGLAQVATFGDNEEEETAGKNQASQNVVGAISCKYVLEPVVASGEGNMMRRKAYIMSLAVLAPFRMYGIATRLVEAVISSIIATNRTLAENEEGPHDELKGDSRIVEEVYVHAWTGSQDAIEWYLNRGFKQTNVVQGYYRTMRPKPGDAVILSLKLV